jgi:DNA-binding transcriptional MerR regulator
VVDVALLRVIRRWHCEGVSIREIARRTKLSRKPIAKYVASDVVEPRYLRRKSPSQLDAYAAELIRWLERNARQLGMQGQIGSRPLR